MEANNSLQHLTPIARLLIPYYKRKHKISLTSNLIIHSEEISALRKRVQEKIAFMRTSAIEFARFLQMRFGIKNYYTEDFPQQLGINKRLAIYKELYEAIPQEHLETAGVQLKIRPLTDEELQKLYEEIPKKVIEDIELREGFDSYIFMQEQIWLRPTFLYKEFYYHLYSPQQERELLEKDLKNLSKDKKSAAYLYYDTIKECDPSLGDKKHNDLFLVREGKICLPTYFRNIWLFPNIYYKIPMPVGNLSPIHVESQQCNLLHILYSKALLKNDGQYLKESIFFEKYNSNGEIERIFVPHPEVLKYSHSEQYNKYILSLTSDGKYSHKIKGDEKEKEFKYPSIREMLSESIANLEKLKASEPKAFTEEMEKSLSDNKRLLAELPSIDEKFKKHYKEKVEPWRENIQEGWYTPWDRVKRGKLEEKLPAYADAYLEKNDEGKNIYLTSEIIQDIEEKTMLEPPHKMCNKLIGENKKNNKADNNIPNVIAIPTDVGVTESSQPLTTPCTPEDSKTAKLKPLDPQAFDIEANPELIQEKPASLINNSKIITELTSNRRKDL